LRNLKAREIADKAGCALGAIYNLVEDMDEIVLRVGTRTLGRLDNALSEAAARRPLNSTADAVGRMVDIALLLIVSSLPPTRSFGGPSSNIRWPVRSQFRLGSLRSRCAYSNIHQRRSAY
jgi:AcrR family transcriptional regulator